MNDALFTDAPPPPMQDANLFTDAPPPTQMSPLAAFGVAQDLAPWNVVRHNTTDALGEKVGTSGQGRWMRPAAALGALIQTAPDILAASAPLEEITNPTTPIMKGLTLSPQELGPEYDALHESAGISKNLPIARGTSARFPNLAGQPSSVPPPFAPTISPLSYAKDPNTLMNFARARMEGLGDQLSPQELNDYRTLLGQMIDTGKVGGGPPLAMASQLKSQATDLLNNRVQGLADLNKAYSIASKVQNPSQILPDVITNGVKKYGPWFARGLAFLGAGEMLRRH